MGREQEELTLLNVPGEAVRWESETSLMKLFIDGLISSKFKLFRIERYVFETGWREARAGLHWRRIVC